MKKIFDLVTPDLGDTDKIELINWYIAPGAKVEIGQEVLELVTDKAAFPMESPYSGILFEILKPQGSIVQKNEVLGRLEIIE